ncbi:MAG: beta-galactosidase [Oscillospiraceae bacterium]|nr:beta-galactosidase [Oscillospiraceae bacterium]
MEKNAIFPKLNGLAHGGDYNPDQWLGYPDIFAQDIDAFKKAGINCVSLGIFSWASYEPVEGEYHFEWLQHVMDTLYENGIYTILATPSGARPAWLDKKYPECMRVDAYGIRNHHGDRHNHCMSSKIFREKLNNINTLLAQRFANHPGLIMWHISNEMGGECFCPECIAKFQEWLKVKYHNDIDELNHAWWTTFWSHKYSCFEEIEPPFWNGETSILGLNLDWKRFTSWNMTDCMNSEIAAVKAYNPDIPVTANLMNFFNGLDYREVAKDIDYVSWDSYPRFHNDWETFDDTMRELACSHALFRGLKPDRPFMLMECTPSLVNWQPYNKLKRPGVMRLQALQAIATGSDTVQYFQLRKSRGSFEQFHGAVIDHAGIDNRVFREVAQIGADLKKLSPVAGTHLKADVAILFDWDNRWAIQDMKGMIYDDKKYERVVIEGWKEFNRAGAEIDLISYNDDFSKYKVIYAPMLYIVRPEVAKALTEFVKNGGQLLCTYMTGYVNETLLAHLGGFPGEGLSDLFGIYSEELDTLFPSDRNHIRFADGTVCEVKDCCEVLKLKDAQVLAEYTEDFYKDTPAVTVKKHGKGNAYYYAARVSAKDMVPIFEQMCKDAGVALEKMPETITHHVRYGEEGTYHFYLNISNQPAEVCAAKGTDLLTEKAVDGNISLEPYGVAVVKAE